jgi:hypothetical protein
MLSYSIFQFWVYGYIFWLLEWNYEKFSRLWCIRLNYPTTLVYCGLPSLSLALCRSSKNLFSFCWVLRYSPFYYEISCFFWKSNIVTCHSVLKEILLLQPILEHRWASICFKTEGVSSIINKVRPNETTR